MAASNNHHHYGPWTTWNEDNTLRRICFACQAYQDRYIVAAGGWGKKGKSVVMCDLHDHKCINLPNLPFSGRCDGGIMNGYFYVYNSDTYGKIYRMDLSTCSTWEQVGPAIHSYADAVVCTENQVFILDRSDMYRYDTIKDKVHRVGPIPTPRDAFTAAVVGDKIYVIGGIDISYVDTGALSTVEVFDISTETWSQVPPLPKPIAYGAVTVYKRWIIVTGGYHDYGHIYNTQTFIFNLLTQQWTQSILGLSPPRESPRCTTIGSEIICVGGNQPHCSLQLIHTKHLLPIWQNIKHFILLKWLVDNGRAYPVLNMTQNNIIEKLMTDMCLDVFRMILSFII